MFTEDATCREQPFQAPFVGRAGIREYWSTVTASQTSVELRYGKAIVDGPRVAVEWWANLTADGAPLTLAGEFLLLAHRFSLTDLASALPHNNPSQAPREAP